MVIDPLCREAAESGCGRTPKGDHLGGGVILEGTISQLFLLPSPSLHFTIRALSLSGVLSFPNSMENLGFETPGAAHEIMLHNVFHFMAISFLYYDHLITSRSEFECLWRRPKSHSSYYFFINRYFAFFGNLAVSILGFMDLPPQSCKRYSLFRQLLLIVTQVLICYFLTLRIYALYECSVRVLVYMVGSGAVLAAIACWALFGQKSAPAPMASGCHIGLSRITAIRLAGAWEALFVYDSIIFGLTLFKTWSARRDYSLSGRNMPLVALVLRDGAIYFAVMALANLSNILSFYLGGPFSRGSLSTFASSISVTMMSRLMLNLHETAEIGIFSAQHTTGHTSVESMEEEEGGRRRQRRRQRQQQASSSVLVELDTVWTENFACERQTVTQGGETTTGVSGLATIDEELGSAESSTRKRL